MAERRAFGGKTIYGARIGILILDARYPRIPGDPVNAATWPFPVLYKVVKDASPKRVIRERATGLLDAFLAAADDRIPANAALDDLLARCGRN